MTSHDQRRYLVAYDIASDHRRARVARVLQGFGDRVQYSVFVVDIKSSKLIRLRDAIIGQIDMNLDSVLVCDLGPLGEARNSRFEFIGLDRPMADGSGFVL